jgi:hypothetical protein
MQMRRQGGKWSPAYRWKKATRLCARQCTIGCPTARTRDSRVGACAAGIDRGPVLEGGAQLDLIPWPQEDARSLSASIFFMYFNILTGI